MKKLKILLTCLITTMIIFTGCAKESPNVVEGSSDVMLSIADTKPSAPDNSQNIQLGFNLDLLKELSKSEKNTFYSSFSINQALTMAYYGAKGVTQEEIGKALGYQNLTIEDVAAYQKYLLETYKDSGDTTFYSANSLWIDDEIIIKKSYIDTMIDSFDADVESVDLQGDEAVPTLNKWIDKKTNGLITKLYDTPFDSSIRLVLMNAIYFKGEWSVPFDPDSTSSMEFNGLTAQSQVDMMWSNEEVLGYEGDDYKAISMPYGEDERFHMVAVLPDGDISEFIQNQTSESLNNILTTFETKSEAIVLFPKFEMEEKILLNDTLKVLGMETAFLETADFGEISDTSIMIDEVLHKAKIIVDEEGTEAAAVTGITLGITSVPMNQFEFVADKPFIFFIMDTENNTALFTGIVYDLEK